jgi:hypothetical protein
MKFGISIIAMVVAIVATGYSTTVAVQKAYEEYVRTSEELLMALEEMCEQNDLPWGDTICETDVWEDYCEAREALGLVYLEHYSKR